MKTNSHRRAEDILADDSLSEDLINGRIPEGNFQEEELFLAGNIRSALSPPKTMLSPDQKDFLGQQITARIIRSKRNKAILSFSSAAVFLILVGLTLFFQLQNQSGLLNFASNMQANPQSAFTQLLLAGEKIIQIEAQESKIAYSSSGQDIKIDEQKKIEQVLVPKEMAYNSVIVPYGKRSHITLSDNSTIWLNSGSKLVYPVCFADDKREVFLDGEAIFEITPDPTHPFHVVTQNMEVKVLGTVFDLCAYSDEDLVTTVLEHGSVELSYKSHSLFGPAREKMVPGMLAAYNISDKTLEQQNVNTKDYTSWKDGYLQLENKSLGGIVKKLSRYYNVTIEIENQDLADETFSGYLDLRTSALDVLRLISETMDMDLDQSGRLIKIKKR